MHYFNNFHALTSDYVHSLVHKNYSCVMQCTCAEFVGFFLYILAYGMEINLTHYLMTSMKKSPGNFAVGTPRVTLS